MGLVSSDEDDVVERVSGIESVGSKRANKKRSGRATGGHVAIFGF